MMDIETIIAMNKQQGRKAKEVEKSQHSLRRRILFKLRREFLHH